MQKSLVLFNILAGVEDRPQAGNREIDKATCFEWQYASGCMNETDGDRGGLEGFEHKPQFSLLDGFRRLIG